MFVYHNQGDKVASAKLIAWLFYGLGVPTYVYALYINITTWKSDVLFVMACMVLGIDTYWRIKRNQRADKKSAQEEIIRELEIENLKFKNFKS